MSTYLIDFENVKSGGLAGIDHIGKEDSVHLFWSARENKITIEMMELIRSSESEIVMHKAVTGERDALDHQLCSYLGFLAGARGENDFVIVSNDKAYDHLIEFWRKLNDQIHIQRVSEISRAAETVHTVQSVRAAETSAEAVQAHVDASQSEPVRTDRAEKAEKTDKSDKGQSEFAEVSERVTPDSYGSRNSRRRERGSRYLKGGRTGRGSRKNNYAEERPEEEKTADAVRETGGYQAEAPVPAEPKKESAAAYVVTGIRTGILVESGFTADGIMKKSEESPDDFSGKNSVEKTEENTAENTAESAVKQAEENMQEAAAEKVPENDAEEAADHDTEKQPENDVKKVPENDAEKAADLPAGEVSGEKIPETVKVSEPPSAETVSEISGMKPAELSETEMPGLSEKETAERPAEAVEGQSGADGETEEKPADEDPAKEEAEEKQSADNGRKPRSRASRTTTRAKRGRPSQKEHTEHFPEIRVPIIESDVIAKCEEAAGAEWTGEVVRLINHSKDKKELYSAIVKLLGQEKGRTVYHAIKVLK
ncbi:MAG: PIN domain-containing protein [Lachnospiraceae bacterium]